MVTTDSQEMYHGIPIYRKTQATPSPTSSTSPTSSQDSQPQQQKAESSIAPVQEGKDESKYSYHGIPVYPKTEKPLTIGSKLKAYPNPSQNEGLMVEDDEGKIHQVVNGKWETQKFSPKQEKTYTPKGFLNVVGKSNEMGVQERTKNPTKNISLLGREDRDMFGNKYPDIWPTKQEKKLQSEEEGKIQNESIGRTAERLAWQIGKPIAYGANLTATMGAEAAKFLTEKGIDTEEFANIQSELLQEGYAPARLKEYADDFMKGHEKAAEYFPAISSVTGALSEAGRPIEAVTPGSKALSVVADTIVYGKGGLKELLNLGKMEVGQATVALGMYNGLVREGVPEEAAKIAAITSALSIPESPTKATVKTKAPTEPIPTQAVLPKNPTPSINFNVKEPTQPNKISEINKSPSYDFSQKFKELHGQSLKFEREEANAIWEKENPAVAPPKEVPIPKSEKVKGQGKSISVRQDRSETPITSIGKKELEKSGSNFVEKAPGEPLTPVERLTRKIGMDVKDPNEAGMRIKQIFLDTKEHEYQIANKLYKESEKANENILAERAGAFEAVEKRLGEAEEVYKNTEEMSLVREGKKLLKLLGEREGVENPILFNVSNQKLIDAATKFRGEVRHKFPHQGGKNIFYEMIDILEDSILETAKANPEAYRLYARAKNFYAKHAKEFNNPLFTPFLDLENTAGNALFAQAQNKDTFNVLSKVLERSRNNLPIIPGTQATGEEGVQYLNSLKKKIIEKEISPMIQGLKEMEKIQPRQLSQIQKHLQGMGIKVSTEEISSIVKEAHNLHKQTLLPNKQPFVKEKIVPKPIPEKPVITSKYEKMTPEKINKEIQTTSGLKEMRESFSKYPELAKQFEEEVVKEAVAERLHGGKVFNEKTNENMKKVLQDQDTRRWIKEAAGEDYLNSLDKGVKAWEEHGESVKFYEEVQRINQQQFDQYSKEMAEHVKNMEAIEKKFTKDQAAAESLRNKKLFQAEADEAVELYEKRKKYEDYMEAGYNVVLDVAAPGMPGVVKRYAAKKAAKTTSKLLIRKKA